MWKVFWKGLINSYKKKKRLQILSFTVCFTDLGMIKFANGGLILISRQFLILPQLPQKIKLVSKVVKIDPKIIVLLPKI